MDAVKTEVKIEIKAEPVDIMNSLKDEVAVDDDDEYVVAPKRLRRNQGTCCAIIREHNWYSSCKHVCCVTEVSMARNCPFLDTINRLVILIANA